MRGEKSKTTDDLLIRGAKAGLDLQREDGSFPPGHAGTYDYSLKPVRTTSGWLLTFSGAYEITDNEAFANAAHRAIDYLLAEDARPHGHTFHVRETQDKDKCDGLVGQASPIKALSYSGKVFNRNDAIEVAEEVFTLHPFNRQFGLWKRVEINGTHLSFDRTLNHQLIFAAGAAHLAKYSDTVAQQCQAFLDQLATNIDLHDDGLPRHYIRPPVKDVLLSSIRNPEARVLLWNELAVHYYSKSEQRKVKEKNYYLVITTALADLKHQWPNHQIWSSETIHRLLEYMKTTEYKQIFEGQNDIGTGYPWLDHAITKYAFNNPGKKELEEWIGRTIKSEYDPSTGLLTRTASDPDFRATSIGKFMKLPSLSCEPAE